MATNRTVSDLLDLFRDGQAAKSITSVQFQDMIASLHPATGNFVDLPTSAAGLEQGRVYLSGDLLQVTVGGVPVTRSVQFSAAGRAAFSAAARAKMAARTAVGGRGALVADAIQPSIFYDGFSSLSLADDIGNHAGTWHPVAYWSPDDRGLVAGECWLLNPNNAATPISGSYSGVNSQLQLLIQQTPAPYLSACGGKSYVTGRVVAPFVSKFGRFEARMAVPAISGTNSSFYLLSSDSAGRVVAVKIEIVSGANWSPRTQYQFSVLAAYTPPTQGQTWTWNNVVNPGTGAQGIDTTQMHTYAFDVRQDYVTCLIDNIQCLRVATPAGYGVNPWDIYLGTGSGGDWTGPIPGGQTFTPMAIDYARVTQVPSTPVESFTYIAWGDTKYGQDTLGVLASLANTFNPAFTLYSGDIWDTGWDQTEYNNWKNAIGTTLFNKTFAIKGNHDAGNDSSWQGFFNFPSNATAIGATNYAALYTDLTYAFQYKNNFFVGIDGSAGDFVDSVGTTEINWIDQQITAAEARGVVSTHIFTHGAIYYVDDHPAGVSTAFTAMCNKHPTIRTFFHGHEHVLAYVQLNSSRVSNITHSFAQFDSGTAGADLYSCAAGRSDWCTSQAGLCLVTVTGGAIKVDFYNYNGDMIHSVVVPGDITAPPPPPPPPPPIPPPPPPPPPPPVGAGASFFDDFSTLNMWNIYNHVAGQTWQPAEDYGPLDAGFAGGEMWVLNPFNPATPINTIYTVSNSVLTLKVDHTPSQYLSACGSCPYLQAQLKLSKYFSQTYGYFEVRMAVSKVGGTGAGFILYSNQGNNEIDVIQINCDGNANDFQAGVFALHNSTDYTVLNSVYTYDPGLPPNFDCTNFHSYGVYVTASTTSFYIDRVQYGSWSTPSGYNVPLYPIIYMGGADPSSLYGNVDGAGVPAIGQFDYVGVWPTRPF